MAYSSTPEIFASVVALTFLAVTVVFFVYDMFVQRRNNKLIDRAARSNAIVSSMFPGAIRDRLIGSEVSDESVKRGNNGFINTGGKRKLKNFLNEGGSGEDKDTNAKPLADLFLETTVLFAGKLSILTNLWAEICRRLRVCTLSKSSQRPWGSVRCP